MLKASIDIGSNSILLLIAQVESDKIIEVIENHSNVTGLGRNLDENSTFIDEAMNDSRRVLLEYTSIIKKHNIDINEVIVTATEASRVSLNAKTFFDEVSNETGLKFNIITGEAEAYFSTKGILIGSQSDDMVIMDIGGASTELILLENRELVNSFSMPMGAVRVKNWIEKNVLDENISRVTDSFRDELNNLVPTSYLHCVAGTMTSVANMDLDNKNFEENQVHGHKMSSSRLKELLDNYKDFTAEQFLERFPFLGKRSQTIKAGLILANSVVDYLKVETIEVSTYGLRYGTLVEGAIKDGFIFKQ